MTRTRAFINMHIATVFFGLSGVFAALIPASAISVVWGRTAIAVVVLFGVCLLQVSLCVRLVVGYLDASQTDMVEKSR